jgi:MFS family permease
VRVRLPFFYGWIVVAVAFVTMAIGVSARTAFSLLFPPILDEFGWERGVTAGAFSLGFMLSALCGPLLGRLMDRKGPRLVVSLGVVLVGTGMALAARIREVWHLYATLGALVAGGSLAVAYTGQSLYLPNWFVRKRGLAIGIAFSGAGIGSIVLLPWMQGLISRAGWRHACLSMAVVVFVVLLPLNLVFPRRRPEDVGLHPDGDAASVGAGSRSDNVVDRVWAATDWTLARAVGTARFWWIALGFFTSLFAWYAVQVHQTKYLIEIGFGPEVAAYALGLVGLMGVLGQIALGYLSDRIGREWVWALGNLGFVVSLALLLVMRQHPTTALLYLMVAAQGVLGYGLASVFGAIPAEIFQGRHYGTIFGTLTLASVGGSGVGPWVAGALFDKTGSYVLAFWIAIACSVVSAVAIWLAAPGKVRVVAGRIRSAPADPAAT